MRKAILKIMTKTQLIRVNQLSLLLVILGLLLSSESCRNQNAGFAQAQAPDSKSPITTEKNEKDIPRLEDMGYPIVEGDTFLIRKAYVVSYNKENLIPNWVAWELTAEHADGPWPRDHHYYDDMSVPEPRCTTSDYHGIGKLGLSRGHMCPAGDCKWDSVAMAETNLLTNICPQEQGLNSGMWNQIEQASRRWAIKYGRVYIVCGPLLYRQEHMTIGNHGVVVPEAFFKIILRLGDDPACIGYVMKNGERGKKRNYINSLAQVERITGYHFFPNLDDSIRHKIENLANENLW